MLLTLLAEQVKARLNANKAIWLPDEIVTEAEVTIDWVTEICQPGFKILIVPELNQYTADETNSRERIKGLQVTKYLSIIVSYTFKEHTYNDTAATWAESKFIIDVRERIELFLLQQSYSDLDLLIVDIESQPMNEQELDRRNFNAITSIGFDEQLCDTVQASSSLSTHSSNDTESAEKRASIRRAALSERRLGRR